MSEKLKGSLSAIIDGEADEFELRRVLDEIDKNEELRATWERYHLIGARLRGERIDTQAKLRQQVWDELDFAEEVDDVSQLPSGIAVDDDPQSQPKRQLGRWTGIAVAATVAIAVVLGFNNFATPVNEPIQNVVVLDEPGVGGTVFELAPEGEDTAVDRQRQYARMIHHAQLTGLYRQGFAPFIKMATYGRK